jgi:uncharacterized protein YqjF (DUF2071 family)
MASVASADSLAGECAPGGAREAPRFLTAAWRDLVMLSYEVDPRLLASRVPRGTELDAFGGRTFASIVGFRFLRTRVLGVAIPGHRDFEELNLRFYVARDAPDGLRRGVAFVKEIVPRRAVAWVARRLYNENYVALPMRHDVVPPDPASRARGRARYEWRLGGAWNRVAAEFEGAPALPQAGSQEEFVTEHYWGYVGQSDGGTIEYRVEHPRWRVWNAAASELHCDLATLYGPELAEALSVPPASAFVAEGSEVLVRFGNRIA